MNAVCQPWAAELLRVWFDELGPDDWFDRSGRVDQLLREKFEHPLVLFGKRPPGEFTTSPTLARAAILLFDQIPRNIYRNSTKAFATDPLARAVAKDFLANDWDHDLPDAQRQFVAMPLMHSEDIADQKSSIAYFAAHLPDTLPFARSHHEMIARFGRFPHRNGVLGRATTAGEQAAIDAGFDW